MKFDLELGSIAAKGDASKSETIHIVYKNGPNTHYTVAFIEPRKSETCDMRTVGSRPWEIKDVSSEVVFAFAKTVMQLVDQFKYERD